MSARPGPTLVARTSSGHALVLALALILAAPACRSTATGYPFSSRAVYGAPHTGLRAEITASGHVAAGEDLASTGTGRVILCPVGPSAAATVPIQLEFRPHASGSMTWTLESTPAQHGTATWTGRDAAANLEGRLRAAGYLHVEAAERDEFVLAIDGAIHGPKGTYMDGQTHALRVLGVRFDRTRAALPTHASPCGSF